MELLLSASEMCLAPSASMLLSPILRARAKRTRQGVLTVGKWAQGGVQERLQRRVGLEGLRQVLGALSTDLVGLQTTNGSRDEASGGADSRDRASGGVLELFEARVRLESLAERPCALWTDAVVPEAVNGGQITVSWGADNRQKRAL